MKTTSLVMLLTLAISSNAHAVFGVPDDLMNYFTKTISLPQMNIDRNSVTVSGISSGGFMAVQLGVAYSSQIKGVGIVAGGIYDCAEGREDTAKDICMKDPDKIDVQQKIRTIANYSQKGLVDSAQNISNQKVLVLQGTEDTVVHPAAGPKLEEFYRNLGANVTTDFGKKIGHGFPSSHGSNVCNMSRSPWVNDCGFSAAEEIFKTLYGNIKAPPPKQGGFLGRFDQSEFGAENAKMLDYGYLYVPTACADNSVQCKLHIALHGCLQSPNLVGKAFVDGAEYNRWAEANNIIVLYPSATTSTGNLAGCWDWYGYTGQDYATKKSPQGRVIMKMVKRLLAKN